jgi:HPr kinase/phosphorylase
MTSTTRSLTLGTLVSDCKEDLDLTWLTPEIGHDREVVAEESRSDVHHTSAEYVGHLNLIHPKRVQVIGREEQEYLKGLEKITSRSVGTRLVRFLVEFLEGEPRALIFADGATPQPVLLEKCVAAGVPVFSTPLTSAEAIDVLRVYLSRAAAETTSLHGVFMDVLGMGVLITGDSGVGKSELALELISRAHGLVADDSVDFFRLGPKTIEGRCPELLKNMLEVRGLGLLNVRTIFGETAVRRKMKLKLIVHLAKPQITEAPEYERLPLNALTQDVLGVTIRKVVIPVAAGRNLAVLLEAAVRNTILQLRGIDSMAEFMARQQVEMQGGDAQ